jgi:hypothetical protein
MKGVSLAIETIVYIILAVLVLTVLLYFFMSQATPGDERVRLERTRIEKCGEYARYDNKCNDISSTGVNPIVNSLSNDICKKLTIRNCPGVGEEEKKNCIRYCCAELCPSPSI